MKSPIEKQIAKKRHVANGSAIFNFFGALDPYKNDNVHHKFFGKLGYSCCQKPSSHSIC
jgi:hypothetical protein